MAHSAGTVRRATFEAGERATVRFAFDNFLGPSRYTLTPDVGEWDPDYRLLDQRDDVASLIVEASLAAPAA